MGSIELQHMLNRLESLEKVMQQLQTKCNPLKDTEAGEL